MSDRATKISLAALMLLNILDASTTLALTDANLACEINPIMKEVLEWGPWHFILIKMTAVLFACYIFWSFRGRKLTKYAIISSLVAYCSLLLYFCVEIL